MKFLKAVVVLVALCITVTALPAAAQTQTLNMPRGVNNSNSGVMFDIQATNTVTINGFVLTEVFNEVGTGGTFRVYGRAGSHVGHENSAAGWTLLATGSVTAGDNVAFPTPFGFVIPAGQTGALYITTGGQTHIVYRTGTGVGNAAAADANITAYEGTGKNPPDFDGISRTPRVFVGDINYSLGVTVVPTMTEWTMILLGILLAGAAAVIIHRRSIPA